MKAAGIRLTLSQEAISTIMHALEILELDYSGNTPEVEGPLLEEVEHVRDLIFKALLRYEMKGQVTP